MNNLYFLNNKSWFVEFDEPKELEGIIVQYVLTENATDEAKKSYAEYYGDIFIISSSGEIWTEDPLPGMPY